MPPSLPGSRSFGRRWRCMALLLMLLTLATPLAQAAPILPASATQDERGDFLTGPDAADPLDSALRYLRAQRATLGLTAADLSDVELTDRYSSQHNGITHLYLRQRWAGIPVFNGAININLTKDGRIVNYGNHFVADLATAVNTTMPMITPIAAVRALAVHKGLIPTGDLVVLNTPTSPDGILTLSAPGISQDSLPVQLMYQPLDDGSVRLVWDMVVRPPTNTEWLDVRVDAITGQVLGQTDWMRHEADLSSEHGTAAPASNQLRISTTRDTATGGGRRGIPLASEAYRVFPLPAVNPYAVSATLVVTPADALASPFGWHDSNGAAGPEYTITRGNNVHAYQDSGALNASSGDEPDGGAGLTFDFPMDLTQEPLAYRAGATVNLFYLTNMVHDIVYRYGFDEAAGNFQLNNYGHGGTASDYVRAEVQDGSGVANANFATPPDGLPPRMQIFLGNRLSYAHANAPAAVLGDYATGTASFGPATFNATAAVVQVNDGVGTISDGCSTPFVNAAQISGKIAMLDRGICGLTTKALNAQANGAIGVLIVSTVPGAVTGLNGTDPAITIPALALSQADGVTLKAQLGNGLTMTLFSGGPQRDGALDNRAIVHEYGHGLSNRLTGGPSNVNCLAMPETANEGWSDLLALIVTARASDTRTTQQAIGSWLYGQIATGGGVRMYPYTTDMAANPFTYDSIKTSPETHHVGSVWASIVWEVYWNMVDDHGFSANIATGTGGNTLALQLIIDGLSLQPCNPNFIEARDAILAADLVDNGGSNRCRIWEGFAKRGLGYSASAGPTYVVSDGSQAFDMPPQCTFQATPAIRDVCAPNPTSYPVNAGAYFGNGSAVLSVNGAPAGYTAGFNANPIAVPGASILTLSNTGPAVAGSYTLTVSGMGATKSYTSEVVLNLATAPPGPITLTSPTNVATNQALQPTLAWSAPTPGLVYTLEIADKSTFATTIYTAAVRSPSLTLPASLHSGQTYFWRVRAANACGMGPVSAPFSFIVRVTPAILLVDDDRGDVTENRFTAALDALGQPYDVVTIAVANSSAEVTPKLLANYSTVIWHGGGSGFPSQFSDAPLEGFLDTGGCLWITAQDMFARRDLVPFLQTYLGLSSATNDADPANQTVITGTVAPYVGMGPYTLAFPFPNYADILVPDGTAAVAFMGNAGGIALNKRTATYRTTYWGFPFEALPTAAIREEAVRTTLAWCAPRRVHLPLLLK